MRDEVRLGQELDTTLDLAVELGLRVEGTFASPDATVYDILLPQGAWPKYRVMKTGWQVVLFDLHNEPGHYSTVLGNLEEGRMRMVRWAVVNMFKVRADGV